MGVMDNTVHSLYVGEVRVNPHTPHIRSLSDSPLLIAMGITVMGVTIKIVWVVYYKLTTINLHCLCNKYIPLFVTDNRITSRIFTYHTVSKG